MGNFFRGIIRSSSFFRKEIFEILRQPRLVATLVLGPFLILFIFGIGYRDQSSAIAYAVRGAVQQSNLCPGYPTIWKIHGLGAQLCRCH